MEKRINIAELLKDCPRGMELDCALYEDVYFDYVDEIGIIHCYIQHETQKTSVTFNQYGSYNSDIKSKCVVFPKEKNTWDGFVPPFKFKDGDVVFYNDTIAIFKEWGDETLFRTYVVKYLCCDSFVDIKVPLFGKSVRKEIRFATDKEKEIFFDAIKANGYKWNFETKTLEKLIEPKFKVGNKVKNKNSYISGIVTEFSGEEYKIKYDSNAVSYVDIKYQDEWELVPNKFDISILKPFDKVLVRDNNEQKWTVDMFSFYDKNLIYPFNCIGHYVNQCIPYENNEYLLGTNNNCDEFYETWK